MTFNSQAAFVFDSLHERLGDTDGRNLVLRSQHLSSVRRRPSFLALRSCREPWIVERLQRGRSSLPIFL